MELKKRPRDIRSVKNEIRTLFIKGVSTEESKLLWVVGIVYRGPYYLDGVIKKQIPPDEADATRSIIEMILSSPHYDQIRVIMLDSVVVNGRSVVDIHTLYEKARRPVILLSKKKQPFEELKAPSGTLEARLAGTLKTLDEGTEVKLGEQEPVFVWTAGVSKRVAETIVRRSCGGGAVPEVLRVCGLIASAFSKMF